ncbi:MAG: lipoyl(octanoyl) transferase LipB [Actinomycetota bacterium]
MRAVEETVEAVNQLTAAWLGRVDYAEAWSWQRELFLSRLDGECGDSLMLLEHPHTYTLGRRSIESDVLYGDAERKARAIALYRVDRGGRATYHGPGQLVGYPILALGERYDVVRYLRKLEDALIATARDLGVEARRDEEQTGVWVGTNKIGAIGVKITRGITMHGFAFNVHTDLDMFRGIIPCGLQGRWVTSVEAETNRRYSVKEVATMAANHLAEVFDRALAWTHPRSLKVSERSRLEPELTPTGYQLK